VLWDLDISHEYRLTRGADHVGPTMIPRMRAAYVWLGAVLVPEERAEGDPTSPSSLACIRVLREQMEPMRKLAAKSDSNDRSPIRRASA